VQVIVVGGGIFGLAQAWAAAKRGHRVKVIERSQNACGASIRNFGMIWPIGQMPGEPLEVALESRELWLQVARESGIWVNPCGSLHVAYREDEWAVIQEFAERSSQLGYRCELLAPESIQARTPAVKPQGLLGGLFSSTELCVNPPATIRKLPAWLAGTLPIEFHFGRQAIAAESGKVTLADGKVLEADKVIICGGADFETLFPDLLQSAGMRRCKLQMFKVAPEQSSWKIGMHLASGLTLRHYKNFQVCPSLEKLKKRIAEETPELDRYGIHVMASQNELGEIILGDSHLYDHEIEPFDSAYIDDLILRELGRWLQLPNWNIVQRWHGIYAKLDQGYVFQREPLADVHVCTGLGGSGMTLSFGVAERFWRNGCR